MMSCPLELVQQVCRHTVFGHYPTQDQFVNSVSSIREVDLDFIPLTPAMQALAHLIEVYVAVGHRVNYGHTCAIQIYADTSHLYLADENVNLAALEALDDARSFALVRSTHQCLDPQVGEHTSNRTYLLDISGKYDYRTTGPLHNVEHSADLRAPDSLNLAAVVDHVSSANLVQLA
jgi:hypothetical protein